MDEQTIKEVVDYMISYGTEHTNYGNWIFEIGDLCVSFDILEDWFYEHNEEIIDELYTRAEVLDVEQEFDSDANPLTYDVNFGTKYCSNLWEE